MASVRLHFGFVKKYFVWRNTMKLRNKAFAACLLLLSASFSAFASFVVLGPDGNWYKCWYELTPDLQNVLKCVLIDHVPPLEDP